MENKTIFNEQLVMNDEPIVSLIGEEDAEYNIFLHFKNEEVFDAVKKIIEQTRGATMPCDLHTNFVDDMMVSLQWSTTVFAEEKDLITEFTVRFNDFLRINGLDDVEFEVFETKFKEISKDFRIDTDLEVFINSHSDLNSMIYQLEKHMSKEIGGDFIDVSLDIKDKEYIISECEYLEGISIVRFKDVIIYGPIYHYAIDQDNGCQVYLETLVQTIEDTLNEFSRNVLNVSVRIAGDFNEDTKVYDNLKTQIL